MQFGLEIIPHGIPVWLQGEKCLARRKQKAAAGFGGLALGKCGLLLEPSRSSPLHVYQADQGEIADPADFAPEFLVSPRGDVASLVFGAFCTQVVAVTSEPLAAG